MSWFYRLAWLLMWPLMRLLARIEVTGESYIPHEGPVLLVANHQSGWDIVLLGVVFPRQIHFMGKEELWRIPFVGRVFTWLGSFPVRRGEADRRALRKAITLLREGRVLCIFPEGTRHREAMGNAKQGAALIAMRTGAPILPVGLVNTAAIHLSWHVWARPHVRVNIGPTFFPSEVPATSRKDQLESLTLLIGQRIAALLPQGQRGVWNNLNPRPAHPRQQ